MTGILMGAETIDQHGNSFILVVPDVSVYDPGMSESLISAGRLIEAGYNVNFRISGDTLTDGFAPDTFPLYGGSITTPDNLTVIVMEYAGHTWRLPKVRAISKSVPVTTVCGNKVDARASHFKQFVRNGLGAPYLSMPRRQSMLLVFGFERLIPFVAPNVVGFFLANPRSSFGIRKVKLVHKYQQKNCLWRQKNL